MKSPTLEEQLIGKDTTHMFDGCATLMKAPQLPAQSSVKLTDKDLTLMFNNCMPS